MEKPVDPNESTATFYSQQALYLKPLENTLNNNNNISLKQRRFQQTTSP